jgi:hypothetical protein
VDQPGSNPVINRLGRLLPATEAAIALNIRQFCANNESTHTATQFGQAAILRRTFVPGAKFDEKVWYQFDHSGRGRDGQFGRDCSTAR